ncbi:MAG: SMP-30/gluconolactonase/LRE family protein [Nitrospira defluvii]|nr:SMP-30/gluconolactonase/LRE family protein [Nitrospira defluvii]
MTHATQSGIIETMAGNGEPGYAGDGGPAGAASLNEPKGLCVDQAGNLYIADSENHVVRRVDRATGVITTVAGVCPAGMTGPVPSQPAADMPIAEDEDPFADASTDATKAYSQVTDLSGTVRYVTGGRLTIEHDSGDGGPARHARLNFPSAVAVDRFGNLYIADTMNHRVRKVDAATGVITTVAGTGQARYSGDGGPAVLAALNEPTGLTVNDDALYIADQSNNRVRRMQLATGVITTVAGDGTAAYSGDQVPADQASLSGPSGVVLGGDGLLYVADTFNSRIRSVDSATGQIATVAGDGGMYRYQGPDEPCSQSLSRPAAIAVAHDGKLYMTDSDSHLIRVWDGRTKTLTRLSGTGVAQFGGDGGDALAGSLNYPFGVAVDATGTIYIADTFNHRIRVLTAIA